MAVTVGLICTKAGLGWTTVDTATGRAEDHGVDAPGNLTGRGEQLDWLLDEATRMLRSLKPKALRIQAAGKGKFAAAAERHEVEAVVQVAAHRTGTPCEMLNRDQVRAALGVPRAAGAYDGLLKRDDVKARSNKERREQYLLALAGGS